MALAITSVVTDRPSVDRQESFLVVVEATDADMVFVVINGRQFELASNEVNWSQRIHAIQIGTYTGTFYAYAVKTSPLEIVNQEGPNITVSAILPMLPEEFMRELYKSDGLYPWGQDPVVKTAYEVKRGEPINFTCIYITGGKRQRENVSRHHYKTVRYPITIQVYHTDSKEECQRLFEEGVLYVEEKHLNLNGDNGYNWIDIKDDGKPLPYVNIYSMLHQIELVEVLKKVNIEGY